MRIQRLLSKLGVDSRRAVERAIVDGVVTVNDTQIALGYIVKIGDKIHYGDQIIRVDASHLYEQKLEVLLYHKPIGEVCSRVDDKGRPLVYDALPQKAVWFMVGRLDINTSGLLLFTNRGDVANGLMHPRNQIRRTYQFKTSKTLTQDDMKRLCAGVKLDDGTARFTVLKARRDYGRWYEGVVTEGRNRLVRRLIETTGNYVVKLRRSSYGPIKLPNDMAMRQCSYANTLQIKKIMKHLKID